MVKQKGFNYRLNLVNMRLGKTSGEMKR